MSTFSGISAASSALQAQRKAMDITGENIANVNTAGYTRQRVDLTAAAVGQSYGVTTGGTGNLGGGVTVSGVTRLASAFWNSQVNTQTSLHAGIAQQADTLSQLETTTGEPSGPVSTGLTKLWGAYSTLATSVGATTWASAQTGVVNAANTVSAALKTNWTAVDTQWTDLRTQTNALVSEVNVQAKNVASLNAQIRTVQTSGGNASELMDQRDQAVTRLAELTGSTSTTLSNGATKVYLGNTALVDGDSARTVSLTGAVSMSTVSSSNPVGLQFSDGTAATAPGGQVGQSLTDLNVTVPTAAAQYDTLATQVASAVNGTYWSAQRTQITASINNAASTLAGINAQITASGSVPAAGSTLATARDNAASALAALTGATTTVQADGTTTAVLGTSNLVSGSTALTASLTGPSTLATLNPPGTVAALKLSDNSTPTLGGTAGTQLSSLNTLGSSSYTAFTGTTASSLTFAWSASQVTAGIAANGTNDASTAQALSKLGSAVGGPDATWKAFVADLGARSSTATSQATAAASTLSNAVSNQQSESGVSLDEETSNLLVIQRAYQGAARVLTAVDQMLDTLINSTGMVGR